MFWLVSVLFEHFTVHTTSGWPKKALQDAWFITTHKVYHYNKCGLAEKGLCLPHTWCGFINIDGMFKLKSKVVVVHLYTSSFK